MDKKEKVFCRDCAHSRWPYGYNEEQRACYHRTASCAVFRPVSTSDTCDNAISKKSYKEKQERAALDAIRDKIVLCKDCVDGEFRFFPEEPLFDDDKGFCLSIWLDTTHPIRKNGTCRDGRRKKG